MKAFVFPGQGSQVVGMGKSLYDNFPSAKEVFEEVNDSLNLKLTNVMFNGSLEELTQTENAQPAIMSVSVAIIRVLQKEFNVNINELVSFVAGHSVGEYSALTCSNVFDVNTCVKALKVRSNAMQRSNPNGVGGMAAILGINDMDKIQELLNAATLNNEICVIANDNCSGQIVVSGNIKSIDNVVLKAKEFGAIKAIKLAVSGAFHSPLMQKASEIIAEALNQIEVKPAEIPVISNVTAQAITSDEEIKALLVEQVVKAVRWQESIQYAVDKGVDTFVEIGQGNVLTSLIKRIDRNVSRVNLQEPQDIENFVKSL